jgi:hypothetical protein
MPDFYKEWDLAVKTFKGGSPQWNKVCPTFP